MTTVGDFAGWANGSDPSVLSWCDTQNHVLGLMEGTFRMPGAEPSDEWFEGVTSEDRVGVARDINAPLLLTIRLVSLAAGSDETLAGRTRWAARSVAGRAERVAAHLEATLGVRNKDWQ